MAYYGNSPAQGDYTPDEFVGNGATKSFPLSRIAGSKSSLVVTIDGLKQQMAAYTLDGINLVFTEAPASGVAIEVIHLGAKLDVSVPSAGSVAMASLNDEVATRLDSHYFRNALINGNFDVWQRGTSHTNDGYGSDDRWAVFISGSTMTHSRQSFALGQTSVPHEPKYFSRTAVSSVAGVSNYAFKLQKIEGARTFAGRTATLSFYAKADAARPMAIELEQVFGTGGTPSAAVTAIGAQKVNLTTAWQKFTATVTIPSITGKTLGTNEDDSLNVFFWFDAGSNWNTRTASLGQQSGTFDIAQVELIEGSVSLGLPPLPYDVELARCYRYYEKSGGAESIWSGYCVANHSYYMPVLFKVPKRAAPSVTTSIVGANAFPLTNPSASTVTIAGCHAGSTASATSNNGNFYFSWTASAEL